MKRLRTWIPRSAWLVALVGFTIAFVWSLVIPPFHVPDETAHFAYVQYLTETGKLPKNDPSRQSISSEENATLAGLGFSSVAGNRSASPPWNTEQEKGLRQSEQQGLRSDDAGGYTPAINNPPLYYLVESVPYLLSPDTTVLGRLQAMRFISALLAGLTSMFIFLFLRELLPRASRSWVVGAVACALAPEFIFITAGVNNDALMFTLSAAMFFAIAYAFRHGLTRRTACVIGALAGLGLMTKFTFAGLLPGVALAVLLLMYRARIPLKEKLVRCGSACLCGAVPVGVVVLLCSTVWSRPLLDASTSPISGQARSTFGGMLSYIWQLYLPKLPSMGTEVKGNPLYDLWLSGFVGRFGWVDYSFSDQWVKVALVFVVAIAIVACMALFTFYDEILRKRWSEWISYAVMAVGTLVFVGAAGYQARTTGITFEQPRYLLGLLPLWGAFLAIGSRAGGNTSSQIVGSAIVMAAIAHNFFALLLTLERYYA